MARAVKQPLGGVRGRVGDVIYRYMNGKSFISVYNSEVKISQSQKSIENRNKFGAAIKFAKAVNSVGDLKKVWDYSNAPGRSAYTKIFKENNHKIHPDYLSPLCSITPQGIGYNLDSFELDTKFATVKIKIDRTHEQNLLPPYDAHFIVFLSAPIKPDLYSFTYYAFTSVRIEEETPDEFQTIVSKFIGPDAQLMTLYKKATAFFAITKTGTKPYECLNTCSKEFTLS
ncbi:MAG: hypothetical protein ACOYN6_00675 [Ignavibacteria bacterium]